MPQPKQRSQSSRSRAPSGAAAKRTGRAAASTSRGRSSAARSGSGAPRSGARSGSGAARSRSGSGAARSRSGSGAARSGSGPDSSRGEASGSSSATGSTGSLRELLLGHAVNPLNIVMLTGERMQEAFDDAVQRGRVTRDDAEELVSDLLRRGRKQTEDVLSEIEELLGKQLDQFETATGDARQRAAQTRRRTRDSVRKAVVPDRVLREVDRARRATGLGPTFPIIGYDELVAAQVIDRLEDLTAAQLRKVRDHERRNANRKMVLTAVERKLA